MTVHSGLRVGQRDNLIAVSCELCGFIHLDPIPDNDRWYTKGYYHRLVKPDYRKEYDEDAEWWNAVYGDWISFVEEHGGGGAFLDVGAGTGHFVDAVDLAGYQVNGIEPDEKMAAQNDRIWNRRYTDLDADDEMRDWTWGVISSHWVMEHLSDPVHFLNWAHGRLTDEGLLLVTIPNDFTPAQSRVMSLGNPLITPFYWLNAMHVNYWYLDSFRCLLENNGYEVLSVYGSWEPELYLLNGQIYLNDHILGRKLHGERKLGDLAMTREARLGRYLELGNEGRGRDLTFLARKAN